MLDSLLLLVDDMDFELGGISFPLVLAIIPDIDYHAELADLRSEYTPPRAESRQVSIAAATPMEEDLVAAAPEQSTADVPICEVAVPQLVSDFSIREHLAPAPNLCGP